MPVGNGYYSGVVFQGYIKGIPDRVLSGGRYDGLMKKLGKRAGAIGFAVYLDSLERFGEERKEYDVDVMLIYSENSNLAKLNEFAEKLISGGETVLVLKEIKKDVKYKRLINFDGEVAKGEINA